MMKPKLAILGALLFAGSAAPSAGQGATKLVAFVNSRVLVNQAPGSTEAQAMLDKEIAVYQAMVAKWSDSVQALKKELDSGVATMSPTLRAQKQKALDDRIELYTRRQDSLQQVADKRRTELLQPVLDLVQKVIQDTRSEGGYAMILDIADGAGSAIIAYDKNLDITDQVLVAVKKQPAPKLPASKVGAPAAGPAGVKKPPPPPAD